MILVDAGPLLAMSDPQDASHATVVARLPALSREGLVIPSCVIAEVAHFLPARVGIASEVRFLRLLASERFVILDPILGDYSRAADLVERYADFPLGTVDALIVAMAERLGVTTLLTLDRRHFGAIKPAHCESFALVP